MVRLRHICFIVPLALPIALAGCDNTEENEAQISSLEGELQTARSDLEAERAENEQLTSQIDELENQVAELQQGAGENGGQVSETVRTQLTAAMEKATLTAERLGALEQEPDAPPEQMREAVSTLRQDVEDITRNVRQAAQELGIELETGGAATGGQEQDATGGQTDQGATDGGSATEEEQPAGAQETEGQDQQ